MITLKAIVKQDPAIGAVTRDELMLVSAIIDAYVAISKHWFLKLFIPKAHRLNTFSLEMISATLGRANTFQEPASPVANQVAKAMKGIK